MNTFTDPENAPILAIEYQRHGKAGWQPHSVMTGSRTYDFDWCGPEHGSYYEYSGSGHTIYTVDRYCAAPKICARLWMADGVRARISGRKRMISDARIKTELRKLGIKLIAEPINGNPFSCGAEGRTEYCEICERSLPEDAWCGHLKIESGEVFCGFYSVSAEDAREALRFIAKHRETGIERYAMRLEIDAAEVGEFTISEIIPASLDSGGGVRVGCKFFTWGEIDRIAKLLK